MNLHVTPAEALAQRAACVLLLLVAVAAAACTPSRPYVAADRATYDHVAPYYRAYVQADETLSRDAKALEFEVLNQWRARIESAEKGEE